MTYKAVHTNRHKYIHWVNRGVAGELDGLHDLDRDPYESQELNRSRDVLATRERLQRELRRLISAAVGLYNLHELAAKPQESTRSTINDAEPHI